jgi:alpha-glucoside transport system substrate-binding protein
VEGGDPPDIAALPQPGLMYRLAKKKQIIPLWPEAVALVEKNYAPVWKDLGSCQGTPYGISPMLQKSEGFRVNPNVA